MTSASALAAFLPVAILVVAVPGPSVLVTIGRALAHGRRTALLTVLGNGVGLTAQVAAVAVGLGTLLATATWALTAMRLVGGAYLVWLGVSAIRHRGIDPTGATDPAIRRSAGADLRAGLVLGLTNPKTAVLFAAVLPQFVPPGVDPVAQLALLGLVFVGVALVGDAIWAVAAARARAWFGRSEQRMSAVRAGGGIVLVGLGAYTLAAGQSAP